MTPSTNNITSNILLHHHSLYFAPPKLFTLPIHHFQHAGFYTTAFCPKPLKTINIGFSSESESCIFMHHKSSCTPHNTSGQEQESPYTFPSHTWHSWCLPQTWSCPFSTIHALSHLTWVTKQILATLFIPINACSTTLPHTTQAQYTHQPTSCLIIFFMRSRHVSTSLQLHTSSSTLHLIHIPNVHTAHNP